MRFLHLSNHRERYHELRTSCMTMSVRAVSITVSPTLIENGSLPIMSTSPRNPVSKQPRNPDAWKAGEGRSASVLLKTYFTLRNVEKRVLYTLIGYI